MRDPLQDAYVDMKWYHLQHSFITWIILSQLLFTLGI